MKLGYHVTYSIERAQTNLGGAYRSRITKERATTNNAVPHFTSRLPAHHREPPDVTTVERTPRHHIRISFHLFASPSLLVARHYNTTATTMSGAGTSVELIGDREPNAITVEVNKIPPLRRSQYSWHG